MNKSLSAEIEELSSKFHDIYMKEAHRQGRVLHPDKYDDLDENIKEYDRVLARFVLRKIKKERLDACKEIAGQLEFDFEQRLEPLRLVWKNMQGIGIPKLDYLETAELWQAIKEAVGGRNESKREGL